MSKLLLLVILLLGTQCQIPPTPPPSAVPTSSAPSGPATSTTGPEPSIQTQTFKASPPSPTPPSISAAQFDSTDSEQANTAASSSNFAKAATIGTPIVRGTFSNGYSDAGQAWKYLQSLNGGCCDKCKTICGFAFRLANTNKYLTSFGSGSFFVFYNSGSINQNTQVFTLSQNGDCTWAISIGGNYLSTNSQFGAPYVGSSLSVGFNERWFIERLNNNQVTIQSAANEIFYWRGTSGFWSYLATNFAWSSRLVMEFTPCDKSFGWNW